MIIDQTFGVIHHFRCNHIPSLNFAMILVSPNSCAIFLTFWVTANVSYLWSFSSQSSSPQKKQFGVKFRKSTLLQLTRTSIGSDSEEFQVHHEHWTIQRVSVFDSTSALLYTVTQDLWNTVWFSINASARSWSLCSVVSVAEVTRLFVRTFHWIKTWNNGWKPLLAWLPLRSIFLLEDILLAAAWKVKYIQNGDFTTLFLITAIMGPKLVSGCL